VDGFAHKPKDISQSREKILGTCRQFDINKEFIILSGFSSSRKGTFERFSRTVSGGGFLDA